MNTIDTNRYATLNQVARHQGKTSERYSFIPTSRPIEVLAQHGWMPAKVQEARTRIETNKGFQKHLIRFQNDSMPFVNGHRPELLLTNSHMGSASFKLMFGVYRLVCSNGLIAGNTYETHSIKHVGYTDDAVNDALLTLIANVPQVATTIERLNSIQLNNEEKLRMSQAAIEMIRGNDGKFSVNPNELVQPVRWSERSDNSLWTTFNAIQERAMKGGYRVTNENGQSRYARKVTSVDETVRINRNLWTLAEAMAALKA